MININPMLLCDFYKTTHSKQFPAGTTKLVSYFTPRMSRLDGVDEVVVFGIQAFCKDYLVRYFKEQFFNQPKDKVVAEYKRVLDATIGKDAYDLSKIAALHDLGYLPVEIKIGRASCRERV